MKIDAAALSLVGDRKENQDRVATAGDGQALLLVVVDGMGGHSQGAKAAQATEEVLRNLFAEAKKPLVDPQGFLTLALSFAHDEVVGLGDGVALDHRPRATCAACIVQDHSAFWAHVGDSRIYQLRDGAVVERTRDHSHVELLLREGVIEEDQMADHPMRNLVECCLGGDSPLPDVAVTGRRRLQPGDAIILCTDGLWSGVTDEQIAAVSTNGDIAMSSVLEELGNSAVQANAPYSDNTSACGVRWIGSD